MMTNNNSNNIIVLILTTRITMKTIMILFKIAIYE